MFYLRRLYYGILGVSVAGIIDALHLTISHFQQKPLVCTVSFLNNCETVTSSSYAVIAGVPLAVWGLLFYIAVTVLVLVWLSTEQRTIQYLLTVLLGIGFGVSLFLVGLQIFVLYAFCLYCMLSAVLVITMNIVMGVVWYNTSKLS